MTQFELADLFANHFALSLSIFTAFISATSALLVATYFASHSISSKLARVIIVIYIASAVFFITAFQRNADILVRIRSLFDESMSWHTAAAEPVWILPVAISMGTVTLIAIAGGAIWYFYNARKNVGAT